MVKESTGKNSNKAAIQDSEIETVIALEPTIGRVVLYNDGFSDQRCAAQISYVHDKNHINIGYIDKHGNAQSATEVKLIGQGSNDKCLVGCCEWMPYQINKAKNLLGK